MYYSGVLSDREPPLLNTNLMTTHVHNSVPQAQSGKCANDLQSGKCANDLQPLGDLHWSANANGRLQTRKLHKIKLPSIVLLGIICSVKLPASKMLLTCNTVEPLLTDLPRSEQSLYNSQTLWHKLNLAWCNTLPTSEEWTTSVFRITDKLVVPNGPN